MPANVRNDGWDSSSVVSRALFRGSSSNSGSYKSNPNRSPPSLTKGNYTGYFGPPDAALREFYDRYIPYGSDADTADDPDLDVILESGANMYWAEQPAEQGTGPRAIFEGTLGLPKKQEDKGKETHGRMEKFKGSTNKRSHSSCL